MSPPVTSSGLFVPIWPETKTTGWHIPAEQAPPWHEWEQTPQLLGSVFRIGASSCARRLCARARARYAVGDGLGARHRSAPRPVCHARLHARARALRGIRGTHDTRTAEAHRSTARARRPDALLRTTRRADRGLGAVASQRAKRATGLGGRVDGRIPRHVGRCVHARLDGDIGECARGVTGVRRHPRHVCGNVDRRVADATVVARARADARDARERVVARRPVAACLPDGAAGGATVPGRRPRRAAAAEGQQQAHDEREAKGMSCRATPHFMRPHSLRLPEVASIDNARCLLEPRHRLSAVPTTRS